jgi:signal transduction histidine kinase
MSSELNEPPRSPHHRRRAGLAFSLRLSCYYALFFAAAVTGLFLVAYILIANSQEEAEMQRVAERAAEYQAWMSENSVSLNDLRQRFSEQSASIPDVMFLRVVSANGQSIFFMNPRGRSMLDDSEAHNFDHRASGARLSLSNDPEKSENLWTVASALLPSGLTIQVGKSSRDGEIVLARFRRVFIISVAPVILVGLVGGTLVAFRAMLPVRRLNSTISGILRTGDWRRRVTTDDEGARDLSDLSEQFNRLLDKNEQVIDAMHLSLDSVAHDLRTPMTRLRSTAERALENPADISAARDALADCLEESEDVLSILETLMELGEAEAGAMRLNLERVALTNIANHAIDLYEFVAEDKSITIENAITDDIFLECDRVRMQRLLANLVDNAIKYSPAETTVLIDAVVRDQYIELIVADEGQGIAPSEQARIWDRLYRGDRSRNERGLGLGLSLVRAIAVAHGGTVAVRSKPGEGSTFTVRFPIALASKPPAIEGNTSEAALQITNPVPSAANPPPTDDDLKRAPSSGG